MGFCQKSRLRYFGSLEVRKTDVTRTSCDTVIYTAVFSSVGAAASAKSGVDFNWLWLLIPVGAAALGGCGYAGYKGYKHYINKKRGYAA